MNSKHAPICNERSCDIVIVLPDFVVVLLDFVIVLPDFVVESNKIMWTRQCTDNYCLLTLALCTTIFLLFGSSKILACQHKRDSPLPLNTLQTPCLVPKLSLLYKSTTLYAHIKLRVRWNRGSSINGWYTEASENNMVYSLLGKSHAHTRDSCYC